MGNYPALGFEVGFRAQGLGPDHKNIKNWRYIRLTSPCPITLKWWLPVLRSYHKYGYIVPFF